MARTTVLILMIAAVLTGCASTEALPGDAVGVDATAMPDDWTLDATVLVGRDAGDAAPAHLRPSRCTVFPDGSLHYADAAAEGFRPGSAWLPPRTRTLPEVDLRGVWTLARELGFTDPAAGATPRHLGEIRPPEHGRTVVISVSGGEVRRLFVSNSDDAAPDDDAARLVRHLAALAWADERVDEPAPVRPLRYDLGPDPYARFRR